MIAGVELPETSGSEIPPAPAKKRGGGPRTPEGKEQSKRNALKHGMRAKVLLPDDLAAAVEARTEELAGEFGPESPYEEWLVGEMAKATAKIDRCAELTILDLQRIIDRAKLCWEADRRKVADDLGARLAKDPARVLQALSRSRQGADWKIERWEGLGEALSSNGGWDESQRRLAFDLLGVAPDLRNGSKRVPPEHDATGLAGLVAREIGLLCQAQELSLDALDEAEWSMAAAGMPPEEDACAARLRRYEASARRALLWAHSELRRVRDGLPPSPASGPARDSSRPEPAATQSPLPTLPTLTQSAVDYHVRRSQLVTLEMLSPPEDVTPADEAPADEAPADEAPVVETPVDANKPAVDAPVSPSPLNRAMTSAFSTRAPRNRRERLAREKRARRAVEHSTR